LEAVAVRALKAIKQVMLGCLNKCLSFLMGQVSAVLMELSEE